MYYTNHKNGCPQNTLLIFLEAEPIQWSCQTHPTNCRDGSATLFCIFKVTESLQSIEVVRLPAFSYFGGGSVTSTNCGGDG